MNEYACFTQQDRVATVQEFHWSLALAYRTREGKIDRFLLDLGKLINKLQLSLIICMCLTQLQICFCFEKVAFIRVLSSQPTNKYVIIKCIHLKIVDIFHFIMLEK